MQVSQLSIRYSSLLLCHCLTCSVQWCHLLSETVSFVLCNCLTHAQSDCLTFSAHLSRQFCTTISPVLCNCLTSSVQLSHLFCALVSSVLCNQRNGEYKKRSHLRRFCRYLHRGINAGRHRVQEYRLPSLPSFKCNVLRESLSVDTDSRNIPCATLKRQGVVGNLCIFLCATISPVLCNYLTCSVQLSHLFW
jgi:hypothetical protein